MDSVVKMFALFGLAIFGAFAMFVMMFIAAFLAPLVGYLCGSVFAWMMPESSDLLLQWLRVPTWAGLGHVGAVLAFVGMFFKATLSTNKN